MAMLIVGIADLKVANAPDSITTLGLGSCVGITMYDKSRRIGGLVHIMLPNSGEYQGQKREKFADTGINDLLAMMLRAGASRSALVAKIAGGAHMFGGSTSDILKVGQRNTNASIDTLNALRIPIVANDTGGTHGRTIELYVETGMLRIKTVGRGERII